MKHEMEEFVPTARENFWPMLKSELLQWRLNKTPLWNIRLRNWLIRRLLGCVDGTPFAIQIPFHVSYGSRIHIGKDFFANHNCIIYDSAEVSIGNNVILGPNVVITTVSHPMSAAERAFRINPASFEPQKRADIELVAPVTIGSNVWIAAGSIVCAGVTIGANTVIGAGSVVTRDIPPNVFACGVPCSVIKDLTGEHPVGRTLQNEKKDQTCNCGD